MHLKSLKTAADIREYLEAIIKDRDKSLAMFDKSRAEDTLAHFMHWNGIDFMGECFTATLARGFLDTMSEMASNGKMEEHIFYTIKEAVDRFVSNMRIRVGSGTSNMSSNLQDQFENKFYIEFQQQLFNGY